MPEPMDPSLRNRWHSWAQGALGGSPDQVDAAALAAMRVVVDGGRQSEAIDAAKRAWEQAGNLAVAFSPPVTPVEAPAGSPHPAVARIDELATAEATRRERARSATVRMPGDREIAGTREPRVNVFDPQAVLSQARQGRPRRPGGSSPRREVWRGAFCAAPRQTPTPCSSLPRTASWSTCTARSRSQ